MPDSAPARDHRRPLPQPACRAGVVHTVTTTAELVALLRRVGVLDRWDDIGDLDVSARVFGSVFDRKGFPAGSVPPYPEAEELTVCFYRDDVYLGAILLADLVRLAAR